VIISLPTTTLLKLSIKPAFGPPFFNNYHKWLSNLDARFYCACNFNTTSSRFDFPENVSTLQQLYSNLIQPFGLTFHYCNQLLSNQGCLIISMLPDNIFKKALDQFWWQFFEWFS
jgi:hypothetical protein